jgi:hypothetical protein
MARALAAFDCIKGVATQLDRGTEVATKALFSFPRPTIMGSQNIAHKVVISATEIKQSIKAKVVWHRALKKARKHERIRARWIPSRILQLLLLTTILVANTSASMMEDHSTAVVLQNVMLVSYNATNQLKAPNADVAHHRYDSDSFVLAIDNCSTRCITNELADFVSPPRAVNIKVQGISGMCSATYVGTVRWRIEDDAGVVHEWLILNTYYNASSPYRLLSPQHWSQERKEQ